MNAKIYKVVPFSEVAIGQEFECSCTHQEMTDEHWTKRSNANYGLECPNTTFSDGLEYFPKGCLVRIADCGPETETCTWTREDYAWESACGVAYVFTEEQDSLELNGFIFCHKCGCRINEEESE